MTPETTKTPVGWLVSSFVLAILSMGVLPPIFVGLALYCSYRVYKKDQRMGQVCMTIAGLCLIIGVVVGAIIGAQYIRI